MVFSTSVNCLAHQSRHPTPLNQKERKLTIFLLIGIPFPFPFLAKWRAYKEICPTYEYSGLQPAHLE